MTVRKKAAVRWVCLPALLLLAGCITLTPHIQERIELARAIADKEHFHERIINTGIFKIAAYERISQNAITATIYIEGDGFSFRSPGRASVNTTPTDPIALRLAAADSANNVIYLARPCQYVTDATCREEYWTNRRFAPEVIQSMGTALDDIAGRYGVKKFNLIGFSGGGAVAALLAERRDDIASLRTVAGNLDTTAWTNILGLSPLDGSLNPADTASEITTIAQRHFVGTDDKVVPEGVARSFAKKSGRPDCIAITLVEGASHSRGWVKNWPDLLKQHLESCGN